ncbi:hypothetical protein GMMP15_260004 [Candidatus Magnetomoraceae bacterium gMMP-15]
MKTENSLLIRASLLNQGIKLIDIANALNVSRGHISNVIRGRHSSFRVTRELIRAGVPKKLLKEKTYGKHED